MLKLFAVDVAFTFISDNEVGCSQCMVNRRQFRGPGSAQRYIGERSLARKNRSVLVMAHYQ